MSWLDDSPKRPKAEHLPGRVRSRRRWGAFPRPQPWHRLPPELRAGRVGAIATRLRSGVRDPAFELLLRRIDAAPIHSGNRIEVFARGDEAFEAMCRAVGEARSEVLLESYILRDDGTGRRMLAALAAAAGRGAAVRVLADAFGSFSTRADFWQDMRSHGIEVRLFHKLLPYLWAQAFRDHRKILVVDRRIAFTGGMNIADEYGASRHAGGPWRDTHAVVEGPTAWEMAVVFSEGWRSAGGTPFTIPGLEPREAEGARTLILDSRPGRGHSESAAVLAAVVGAARRTVWITNAYFAPGRRAVRILVETAARGVDVRLMLPARSDVPLVRHAGHGYFADLLRGGVRIFEYQPAVLHAKSLVADDYISVIGSTNLDFRSFRFNAECNWVVLDETVGRRMAAQWSADQAQAREIPSEPWRRRGWAHRSFDALARLLSPIL